MILLQTGQVQVGACSCSWRKDEASKHWLWVQTVDRQGIWIRSVDRGHFSDMTVEVATMSASCALLITGFMSASAALGGCSPLQAHTFADDLRFGDNFACFQLSNQLLHRMLFDEIDNDIEFLSVRLANGDLKGMGRRSENRL